jgi:hypothetical protein
VSLDATPAKTVDANEADTVSDAFRPVLRQRKSGPTTFVLRLNRSPSAPGAENRCCPAVATLLWRFGQLGVMKLLTTKLIDDTVITANLVGLR